MDWNPWYGCRKTGSGCLNCCVFKDTPDKNQIKIEQTKDFHLPMLKNKDKVYKLVSLDNPIYVCRTSDFFIEEADRWRSYAWDMIHFRKDLRFKIITRRIHRIEQCLPKNWGPGYLNVSLVCACEDQKTADERLPAFLELPAEHKEILLEPLLEPTDIEKYLEDGTIEAVSCGGEGGENARICSYNWILQIREQCIRHNVEFHFTRTGSRFERNNRLYQISKSEQKRQAMKADIDFIPEKKDDGTTPFDSHLLQRSKSPYRSNLRLTGEEIEYCRSRGLDEVRREAFDIIRKNIAPSYIKNDGKQTPENGHPIFVSQHATATCCRKCINRFYYIPNDRKLTETEVNFIVDLNLEWLKRYLVNGNDGFSKIKKDSDV